jgi:tetratricopeptide (TPR) repeat protein
MIASGLSVFACGMFAPSIVRADDAAKEESVLVATRELPGESAPVAPATPVDGDALEPIPQSSDRAPELANGAPAPAERETASDEAPTEDATTSEADAQQFGKALGNMAQPKLAEDSAQKASARRAAAASAESLNYEPVKFQGILVGKNTKAELISAWGQAVESIQTAEGEVLVYHRSPFRAIEVLVGPDNVISTIKIALATPLDSEQLAGQLSLGNIEPVTALDEEEQPLGQAFPERGVLFMFTVPESVAPADEDQSEPTVSHVVLQPLDAQAFALRAEENLYGPYAQNVRDLKAAIALDPEFAHAYHLLAKIYMATGQADLADAAAADACDIEPDNAAYQLCHGQTRRLLAEYDDAVHIVRAVLDRAELAPIDRAQALHQMAGLATLGDGEIASKAIPFETRAIEIADTLATSKNRQERRAAKKILIEAHVAIAEEVARQPYNQKVESLALWIGRASGLTEDFIANDGGSVALRLYIADHVLAALASFKPTLDPAPWITEAEEAAKELFARSDDELWQNQVKWELGTAYLSALRVEHTRRETEEALKYGELAIENMAVGASTRQAVHTSEQLVGQLYFQMGAIYAVHKLDHAKAVQWYDKAAPLLAKAHPQSELYAPRREGEMLVSMGVSYWQVGDKQRALDLTQGGVKLVEAAVEGGILAKSTLAVPYGNLATMYQQMGENTNAAKYAELSKNVTKDEPTAKQAQQKPSPRVGRGNGRRMRMSSGPDLQRVKRPIAR